MKKFYLVMIFTFLCAGTYAQVNYDDFVGAWVYQNMQAIHKETLHGFSIPADVIMIKE